MKPLQLDEVIRFIEKEIDAFHKKRAKKIAGLTLDELLKRKNPYLFKARDVQKASEFVKTMVDAHLSSQEETTFGGSMERLAIFVCRMVYDGRKSGIEGIDLEFLHDGKLYLVAVKSGPNWGNSDQIKKLEDNFKKAKKIIRTNTLNSDDTNVIAVNGCCYGTDSSPDKGHYFKYCGQVFWQFISGSSTLYTDIIAPLESAEGAEKNAFAAIYQTKLETLTKELNENFSIGGAMDWNKIVRFNSAQK